MIQPKGITKHVSFRFVEEDDARFILDLRLNQRRSHFISQVDDDEGKQREWISRYKVREAHNEEFYFFILDEDLSKLGVVRLYDIVGHSFCWGSWVLNPGVPSYAAIESVLNIYGFGFEQLGFSRSHFDVRKENFSVINFHKRFGATVVDENGVDYFFELPEAAYLQALKKYRKFLNGDGLNALL